jgi:hypothetical protein
MAPALTRRCMALLLALLLLGCASAPRQQPAQPDPTHPQSAVPPLRHTSVLPRPTPQPDLADWAEANRQVQRIGGWRAYAREAAAAASAPASGAGR